MAESSLEHDPLFQLLTDALRAGPESAEWREAVARVRERGRGDADDFTLLCRARERLAQGREYRAVRPGPTFTRKVMDRIDEEASQAKKGPPWASMIAIVSLAVMAAAIGGMLLMLRSPETPGIAAVDERLLLEGPFDKVLMMHESTGTANPTTASSGAGGGSRYSRGVPPDQAFCVELDYDGPHAAPVELVISVDSAERALVFEWGPDRVRLLSADGSVLSSQEVRLERVRLVIGPTLAKIERNGTAIWTGEHRLPGTGLRIVEERLPGTVARQAQNSTMRILTK